MRVNPRRLPTQHSVAEPSIHWFSPRMDEERIAFGVNDHESRIARTYYTKDVEVYLSAISKFKAVVKSDTMPSQGSIWMVRIRLQNPCSSRRYGLMDAVEPSDGSTDGVC